MRPQTHIHLARIAQRAHHLCRAPEERPEFVSFFVVKVSYLRDVPNRFDDQRADPERPDAVFNAPMRRGMDKTAGQLPRAGRQRAREALIGISRQTAPPRAPCSAAQ